MRILRLRFANINSLAGTWEIDFTHPAYAGDGIFLIAGPTGAGKSSVLDAICLALYGATPRQGKITKSTNELMSRRTGECWAEVEFSTEKGLFRAHFSQKRARNRASGALQQPRHELARLPAGNIEAEGLRDVPARVEDITGLDFTRFTRSMLLAQGGFAAFLQAAPDERAAILEQITGTELYSRISVAVHELNGQRQRELESFEARLAGLRPLDEAQRQERECEWRQARDRVEELSRQCRHLEEALRLLDRMALVEEELRRIREQKEANGREQAAFATELARLEAALRALELDAQAESLQHLRAACAELERRLSEVGERIVQAGQDVAQAQQNAARCQAVHGEVCAQRQEESVRWQKVRELDVHIGRERVNLQEREQAQAQRSQDRDAALAKLRKAEEKKAEIERESMESRAFLQEYAVDARLENQLPVLQGQHAEWQRLQARIRELGMAKDAAERRRDEAQEEMRGGQERETKLRLELEACRAGVVAAEAEREELVKRLPPAGHQEMARLERLQGGLANLLERLDALEREDAALREKREGWPQARKRKEELDAEAGGLEEELKRLQAELEELEKQAAQQRDVDSLSELRRKLAAGEPCPLCGSTHHPWAGGGAPATDAEERLAACREKCRELENRRQGLVTERTRAEERLRYLEAEMERTQDGIQRGKAEFLRAASALGVPEQDVSREILEAKLRDVEDAKVRLSGQLDALSRVDDRIAEERKRNDEVRSQLDEATANVAAVQRRIDGAQGEIQGFSEELRWRGEEKERLEARLLDGLREFIPGLQAVKDSDIASLEARLSAYVAARRRNMELDALMGEIQKECEGARAIVRERETELAAAVRQVEECRQTLERLLGERRNLFGEKNPDECERELEARERQAAEKLEASRVLLAQAEAKQEELKKEQERLLGERAGLQGNLAAAERAFAKRLQEARFSSEADYLSARLEKTVRDGLLERRTLLETRARELEGQEKKALEEWQDLHSRASQEPKGEIEAQLLRLQQEKSEAEQKVGACRQVLEADDRVRQELQECREEYERLQKQASEWAALHDLIGSADGKKYRVFAQGLTLDALVGHANQQLTRLTDRYLLLRTPGTLALSVMDRYQGNEIRPTSNLSGGETFLASLALALGLSRMASRSMRIDSLFLDEGFGTLDPQALECALSALAGLRQEGKIIGIISHVSELRERLPAQIRVEPRAGGVSELAGPGVRAAS